jgi:MFS family permease
MSGRQGKARGTEMQPASPPAAAFGNGPPHHPPEPEARLAWAMVAACAVMVAMGFGAINNIAVFLTPLGAEFHWPRADLSLAYAVATLGTGLGGIVMGHVADRAPIRRVVLCGAFAPGIGFLLLSRLDSTLELYLVHGLLGLLGLGAIMAPLNSLAAQWMPRRPGLAIGVVSAGGAFGQGVLPFLARHLLLAHDWRVAYVMLGVLSLAIMVPLALLLRNPPRLAAGPAPAPAPPSRGMAATPSWLLAWLCVAVLFCCVCMATPIVHVAALGSDLGLGGRESAGLLAVMMVSGMVGRLGFGRLADRVGNLPSYIVASGGQTALAVLFPLMQTRAELYLLSTAFGLVFSGAMTAFILCAREYAPPHRIGLSIGVVMFFAWLGMAVGGWQGGLFFDLCGSYGPSFVNASLGGVANLLVLGLLYRATRPRPQRAAPVPA